MKPISKHISYKEATASADAIRKGLENTPGEAEIAAMELLAEKVFEPLREYVSEKRGKDSPIHINSFFRSKEVNISVGGSKTSQHCLGEAIDIETNYPDFTNKDLFLAVKDKLAWDQLLWEYGDENEPAWVHVSFKKDGNRRQILRVIKENGATKYIPFT